MIENFSLHRSNEFSLILLNNDYIYNTVNKIPFLGKKNYVQKYTNYTKVPYTEEQIFFKKKHIKYSEISLIYIINRPIIQILVICLLLKK